MKLLQFNITRALEKTILNDAFVQGLQRKREREREREGKREKERK